MLRQVISRTISRYNTIILPCKSQNIGFIHLLSSVSPEKPPSNNLTPKNLNAEGAFLVKIQHDPDVFGNGSYKEDFVDAGDIKEHEFLENKPLPSQRLSTKQYADIIKDLVHKRKINEAVEFVEVKMIKEDRVKPENYIYNLLIGACGRVGYTKKAFSLFNDMKKRGLKVHDSTYTSLFNACANSPWPLTDGLSRAKKLRELMFEKRFEPNATVYNAMIKAFGRCGDLPIAFELVDEMFAKKIRVKEDTFNFLLQACISDKEVGFRHALLVWRKFIKYKIKPGIYSYNLLLRTIRDCGLGDLETTKDLIDKLIGDNRLEISDQKLITGQLQISDQTDKPEEQVTQYRQLYQEENKLTNVSDPQLMINHRPNLLAKQPHLGNVLSLSEVKEPHDRLLLVGGYLGFLKNMDENHCRPDIKTFTQLLDSIPSTLVAEDELMQMMKHYQIQPDVDFFNMLIKKRSMRFDYENAREVLDLINAINERPNLITYGVLALGCKTKEEAIDLIQEMKSYSYTLNSEILGAMIRQACCHKNFPYVLEIMDICLRDEIKPNKMFVETLDKFKTICRKISNDKEHPMGQSTKFKKSFMQFKEKYKEWLNKVEIDENEEVHPWTQFRQNVETDTRHYKDKGAKSRFKPRHQSLFKKKTSNKVRW